jgi:hypothetical protein
MKNSLSKQEKERLSNKTVLFTTCVLLYALLLLFIEKMISNSATVLGALSLISIVRWTALGGAMLCAIWSAYKEKKGFYLYCGMCLYVFLTSFTIQFIHRDVSFFLNYVALGVAFVFGQAYYYLKVAGLLNRGKKMRIIYFALCALAIAAIAGVFVYAYYKGLPKKLPESKIPGIPYPGK